MAAYATKDDIKKLALKVDKAVVDLSEIIGGFAQQVDERFNRVESRLNDNDTKLDTILGSIDGFIRTVDDFNTELAARDHKIDRLEKWIKEISSHSGIKLSI